MLVEHCYGLFLDTPGYELSKYREEINKILSSEGVQIDSFQLKTFLSHRFDKVIFWTYVQNVLLHKYRFGWSSRDSYTRKWYIVNQAERQDPSWRIENLWFELMQILLQFKWLSNDCQYGIFRNNRPGGWSVFSNIFLVINYIQNSNYIRKQDYLWHFVSNLWWIDS